MSVIPKPLFTIGVTTYRRGEMIRETLDSIAAQTFGDFEVIIGNDYRGEKLTVQGLGVDGDPRFRVINHPENLGELGNMNALLASARGEYFSWLADDDLYASVFLESMARGIRENPGLECAFSGFEVFTGSAQEFQGKHRKAGADSGGLSGVRLRSGAEFLRVWISGQIQVIGTCGTFRTDRLKQMGGAAKLSESRFALYSEYLLILQCGLLKQVFYDPRPLVYYRFHAESWGCSNVEVEHYGMASESLLRQGVELFAHPQLRGDFVPNLRSLVKLALGYFVSKVSMAEGRHPLIRELSAISQKTLADMKERGDSELTRQAKIAWRSALFSLAWPILKAKVKAALPHAVSQRLLQMIKRRPFQ